MNNKTENSTSKKRLLLNFLSDSGIYSNSLRSFLKHFQSSDIPFQLLEFPDNLYTISERLAEDCQRHIAQWQLPDNSIHPITIAFYIQENESNIFTIDFGDATVAKYLIGKNATDEAIAWLKDLLATGGRMMSPDCAFLSWEENPNKTTLARLETGILSLDSLPLMLWSNAILPLELSSKLPTCWQAERQWDGAWLIIQDFLPNPNFQEILFSLWTSEKNENETEYFLIPDNKVIPSGDFVISNLNDFSKSVDPAAIIPFAIAFEEAQVYLGEQIEGSIFQAQAVLSDWIKSVVDSQTSEKLTEESLSEIIADLMGITIEEAEKNPNAVREGLQRLFIEIKEVIDCSLSDDPSKLEIARSRMKQVGAILTSRGIDSGEVVTKFPDNLNLIKDTESPQNREVIAFLQELSTKIGQNSDNSSLDVEKIIRSMTNSYQGLMRTETEEEARAKREKEYKQRVEQIFEEAFEKYPMPSLDFDDL